MAASTLYTVALEATALLALWLGLGVWQQDREAPGRRTFVALTAAAFVWCVGVLLLEREALPRPWELRVVFLGVLAVPPLWLGVAAHAARLGLARRVPWFPAALLLPSAAFYALLFAGPWSALFLGEGEWPANRGPVFELWTAYAYVLIAAATAILLRSAYHAADPRVRWRCAATALGAVAPLAANAVFIFGLREGRDLTPVLLGISLIALRSGIFQGGLLDALPIHHRDVYRKLPVGIVLADAQDRVIEVNERAAEWLGVPRGEAIGRLLDAVLSAAPPGLDVEVSSLRGSGRVELRCALLRPAEAARDAA